MQIHIFRIPVVGNKAQTEEMNAFLREHKVVDIDKQFVNNAENSFWTFCVRYLESNITSNASPYEKKEKVDYKTTLSEVHFEIFSKLRQLRKQLAESDAVPAYAVFTDDELAEIAKLAEISPAKLRTIPGIGQAKLEKYGAKLIEKFNASAHETDRSSDTANSQ